TRSRTGCAALDAGADDYLTKPFSIEELRARVRARVRRNPGERPAVLTVGDLRLDPAARTVCRGTTAISPRDDQGGLTGQRDAQALQPDEDEHGPVAVAGDEVADAHRRTSLSTRGPPDTRTRTSPLHMLLRIL